MNVVIGIQARSTSKRFPRKHFASMGDKNIMEEILKTCYEACIDIHTTVPGVNVKVALVVPEGDELIGHFDKYVEVVEGSEFDVLGRYKLLMDKLNSDYLVRITGDCVLLPKKVLTDHIEKATAERVDYLSNVDPECRTSADGMDCEVISSRLFYWLDQNAKTESDREHVTTLVREMMPEWAKICTFIGSVNNSALKLSVDLEEDLARARAHKEEIEKITRDAIKKYGLKNVYRY